MRRLPLTRLAVALSVMALSSLLAVPSQATKTTTPSPAPAPTVVGPLMTTPTSATLASVENVFATMTQTVYSHTYTMNTTTGYYAWDCVGMTDWILHRAAPTAWTAMHTTLAIKSGRVPTPTKWYSYLTGQTGPLPTGVWKSITTIKRMRPGDYILFPQSTTPKFVGHAVIVAGAPLRMSDGSYAVRVFDSTGSAHGPYDSRLTDPRAINHSGLGNGTMRLYVQKGGGLTQARWSINAGGPAMRGIPLAVGRALQ